MADKAKDLVLHFGGTDNLITSEGLLEAEREAVGLAALLLEDLALLFEPAELELFELPPLLFDPVEDPVLLFPEESLVLVDDWFPELLELLLVGVGVWLVEVGPSPLKVISFSTVRLSS